MADFFEPVVGDYDWMWGPESRRRAEWCPSQNVLEQIKNSLGFKGTYENLYSDGSFERGSESSIMEKILNDVVKGTSNGRKIYRYYAEKYVNDQIVKEAQIFKS